MPKYIQAHINLFGAWDPKWSVDDVYKKKPGTEHIWDLIELFLERKMETFDIKVIERFANLSPPDLYIPIVPDHQELVERLLRPIKSAKRLCCFEEYLAAIALCGLVGESLAMLVYRTRKHEIRSNELASGEEKQLYGKEFDYLEQIRRIEILRFFNFINEPQEHMFSDLRGVRNKYLHLWQVDSSQIQPDAKKCVLNAMRLLKQISGLGLGPEGIVVMSLYLLGYIKKSEGVE